MGHVRTVLGGTRMLIGVSSWLAPDHAVRVFGIDPDRSDRFIGRLFGSREIVLAGALLAAPPAHRATAAATGAVIDAVDTVAAIGEYRRGNLSTYAFVTGGLGAALFAALGLLVLREERVAAAGSA